MKRVNRFRASLGNINAGANASATITNAAGNVAVMGGTNARLQIWGIDASMTTGTDFTMDVLIGGTPVFTQRNIQTLVIAPMKVGPPSGTFIEIPAGPSGNVSVRLTNNSGSASAANDVILFYTIRDTD